jgi:uncharacterized membrane protein
MLTNHYQSIILSQIPVWTDKLTQVIAKDIGRIAWNTFLALIPLTLSFFLFYKPRSRLFCWSTYISLGLSFIVGIKRYNDGNLLQALNRIILYLWGVRAIFLAIAIALVTVLIILDTRSRSPQAKGRSLYWWIGLLPFILILPNAPYILTDIVHFYEAVRSIDSVWAITLVIVPIYIIFIGVGWLAYVFSLVNIGKYFVEHNLNRYLNITELSLHLICAIGIYIGRFIRFNSWSLITQPKQFLNILPGELIGKFPLIVILLTFLIITILYEICKPIVEKFSIYSKA